jgi:hypothetical protein
MIDNAELIWIMMAVAFVGTLAGRFIVRRFKVHFRPIPAYTTLPLLIADAVEGRKRLHFSLGSSTLGQPSTVSALVAAELIYRMTETLAMSREQPLITTSQIMTLPLAQDTLRRAYEYRRAMDRFPRTAAQWIPQGERSWAFAAGVSSVAADHDVHSSVMLGRYGYEFALIGESALRHDQSLIAHSDLIEGQAVAFVQADHVLLGEELYVGPAYLKGTALERGGVVAQEVLRWLVILVILALALQAAL